MGAEKRLHVYGVARQAHDGLVIVRRRLAAVNPARADQLSRAADSLVLNIAEGAAEFRPREKARFYRMAHRSGHECLAVLDLPDTRRIVGDALILAPRSLIHRACGMLIHLCRSMEARQN